MEPEGIHELTAGYALNALGLDEEHEYEEHLRRCQRCREELVSLQEAAASLAYATEAPPLPQGLRGRIIDQARTERTNVVPLRRRAFPWALGAAAAAAAGIAIGLGIWASSLSSSLSEKEQALARQDGVLALFAGGSSQFPVSGADGTLVVAHAGDAALVLSGLAPAPEGKTYEAWVIEGNEAKAAGTFSGGSGTSVVRLALPVRSGAAVAITVEPAGGVEKPTTKPFAIASTV